MTRMLHPNLHLISALLLAPLAALPAASAPDKPAPTKPAPAPAPAKPPAKADAKAAAAAAAQAYYKQTPLFNPYPTPDKSWNVKTLGPVGIGIDLPPPGFTMVVANVEKGSPAEEDRPVQEGADY